MFKFNLAHRRHDTYACSECVKAVFKFKLSTFGRIPEFIFIVKLKKLASSYVIDGVFRFSMEESIFQKMLSELLF